MFTVKLVQLGFHVHANHSDNERKTLGMGDKCIRMSY